jgi:hypothetical protein
MVCIVYGKTYAEQLRAHSSSCADHALANSCNIAVNWGFKASTATCAESGLQPGCLLSQIWGFKQDEFLSFPEFPPPIPLGVNTTVHPAHTFVLNGQPCRRSQRAGLNGSSGWSWLAPDQISDDCIKKSGLTATQWTTLNQAGWIEESFANASSCRLCLCSVLMTAAPILWWDSVDAWPHSGGTRTDRGAAPCSEQAAEAASFAGLQAAAVILVVALNTLLSMTAVMLAQFERHNTIAEQDSATCFRNSFSVDEN